MGPDLVETNISSCAENIHRLQVLEELRRRQLINFELGQAAVCDRKLLAIGGRLREGHVSLLSGLPKRVLRPDHVEQG